MNSDQENPIGLSILQVSAAYQQANVTVWNRWKNKEKESQGNRKINVQFIYVIQCETSNLAFITRKQFIELLDSIGGPSETLL